MRPWGKAIKVAANWQRSDVQLRCKRQLVFKSIVSDGSRAFQVTRTTIRTTTVESSSGFIAGLHSYFGDWIATLS